MPRLAKHKNIQQALQAVEANPEWPSDLVQDRFEMPVWEMVARNLFDISNRRPTTKIEMAQTTRAQKLILDRLTGTRRMGTHPAVRNRKQVSIIDLTVGILPPVETPDVE